MLLAPTSPLRTARVTIPSPRDGESAPAQIAPTPDEVRNGWTADALAEHVAQIHAGAHATLMNRLFPEKPPLSVEAASSFDPHGW